MNPDGYVELTLKVWPWPKDLAQKAKKREPYKLRIQFQDIKIWMMHDSYVRFVYNELPQENMIIPWWNIVALEYQCNSDEYVAWCDEQRKKEEVYDYAAEEIR